MSRARTEAACLADAIRPTALDRVAYEVGYLRGAIRTAIIRLSYAEPAEVIAGLEQALLDAERGPQRELAA